MTSNTPVIAPPALAAAVEQARQDNIKIRVGVVFTTEQQDWSAVRDWHLESSECLHRKFINDATIVPMGPGRFLVFSTDLTRERLGHNIRSALGFADLPTRVGLSAPPEHGHSADDLLTAAFTHAIK
jgi:hypothetical protein